MKIFITYSRSDQQEVKGLVKDLEALGHDLWYDQDLSGGQSWWDNILLQIDECELYIFGVSQDAIDSTACLRELHYAAALEKNCLPVALKPGVSIAMTPRYISQMQFINYTNPDDKTAVFALIKAIKNLPPPKSLPDPMPERPDVPISYLDTIKEKIEAHSLDKRDQIELLNDIKIRMNDPDTKKDDIIILLNKFRRHDDLLASVGKEIDELLEETISAKQANSPKKPVPQQPQVAKSPTAPVSPVAPQPVSQPMAQRHSTVVHKDEGWSAGIMVLLVFSCFIPLIGIIAGIIGISSGGAKKTQGIILLIISGFLLLIYSAISSMDYY